MKTIIYLRLAAILVLASCSLSALHAQDAPAGEKCSAEVKLLLVPAEVQSAVKAFGAKSPKAGHIYLFDTEALELFSRGVILRVRKRDRGTDLMVKVRLPVGQELSMNDFESDYKCEVDRSGDTAVRSYSALKQITGMLPTSGNDVLKLLSPAQKHLLQSAHINPDWNQVTPMADINSTVWRITGDSTLTRLSLELWQWPSGQLLELSTRAAGDQDSVAAQLRQTVTRKGLPISTTQQQKTALVLQSGKAVPKR